MKCENCGHQNGATARFCENCGRALPRTCPNCGEPASPTAKFCSNCGYNLQSATPSPRTSPVGAPSHLTPPVAIEQLRRSAPSDLQERIRSTRGELEGERKLVTALFADIVGSTELAENLDPEDWREVVSGVHRRVSAAVHKYDGYIAQLLGDGVLAFFGAPLAHEDDAERAVRAGLEIIGGIDEYALDMARRNLAARLQMRIGLNSGTVVVGDVGTDLRMEYLAIGDTVNLAARMQSAADPGNILISENTRRLLGDLFEMEDRGRIAVKGKAEPVQVYCVMAPRKGAARRRGIAGLSSPLVGRERELAALQRVADDLVAGRGGIVTIIAEAGLGKSRLVAEWRKTLVAQPRVLWVEGRCLSYSSGVAYHLIVDLVRNLIGVGPDADEKETGAALENRCAELFGSLWDDVHTALAHLLGTPIPEEAALRVSYLDANALQLRYLGALRGMFMRLSASSPLIVAFDDMQWVDTSSAELMRQLLPLAGEARMVFVCVSRPDRGSAGWRLITAARDIPGGGALELRLAPLGESDSDRLVNNLLAATDLPEDFRRLVQAKAEGNPLFVEELLRMLIDRGVLFQGDEGWKVTGKVGELDIPDSLQGIIMARIDQLPEAARRTLQVAAVIGRRFPVLVLERVLQELRSER